MLFRFIMLGCFLVTAAFARLDAPERDGPEGLWAMYGLAAGFLLSAVLSDVLPELLATPLGIPAAAAYIFAALYLLAVGAIVIIGLCGSRSCAVKYMIVPGTIVNGSDPSEPLRGRLDAAKKYLASHPETICVLSGGFVENRPFSEAEVMRKYLIDAGIAENRLFIESSSCSTYENFSYSLPILRSLGMRNNDKLAICTDLFHYARCLWMSGKLDCRNCCLVPSVNGSRHYAGRFFREVMIFVRLASKGASYKP